MGTRAQVEQLAICRRPLLQCRDQDQRMGENTGKFRGRVVGVSDEYF
jgi:hypothetical protein